MAAAIHAKAVVNHAKESIMEVRRSSLALVAAVAATIAVAGGSALLAVGGTSVVWAGAAHAEAPQATPAANRIASAQRVAVAADAAGTAERTAPPAAGWRGKMKCSGCGVVESIRRIDRREDAGGVCNAADADALPMRVIRAAGAHSRELASLEDTAAAAVGAKPGAKKVRVTTSYQIVVRFRDGTRRLFNEVTPRSQQTGDRVQVIAGIY
jgi:hypothetical protein